MIVCGRNDSHCEILRVENDNLRDSWSIGSVWPKSRAIKFNKILETYECTKIIPLKIKDQNKADSILTSLQRKLYSFLQLIVIAIKIIVGSGIKSLKHINLNLSKYLICTELCGVFMRDAGEYQLTASPDMLDLDEIENISLSVFPEPDNISSNWSKYV
jgi:hypothetical protein